MAPSGWSDPVSQPRSDYAMRPFEHLLALASGPSGARRRAADWTSRCAVATRPEVRPGAITSSAHPVPHPAMIKRPLPPRRPAAPGQESGVLPVTGCGRTGWSADRGQRTAGALALRREGLVDRHPAPVVRVGSRGRRRTPGPSGAARRIRCSPHLARRGAANATGNRPPRWFSGGGFHGRPDYRRTARLDPGDVRGFACDAGGPTSTAPGFILHAAGPVDGGWQVTELWESQQDRDAFFAKHVIPQMPADGPPPTTTVREIVSIQSR